MNVYIIGPDKAGKSTLAKRLANDLGLPYVHCDKPPKGFGREHVLFEYNAIRRIGNAGAHLVVDRGIWCEMVYGEVFRNLSVDFNALREYEANAEGAIIYCKRPVCDLIEQIKHDGGEWFDEQKIREVVYEYDRVLRDCKMQVSCFDPFQLTLREYREMVKYVHRLTSEQDNVRVVARCTN